jgi:TorA maturation chaperone TorD
MRIRSESPLPAPPADVDDALARAVVYRTLSAGFQAPNPQRQAEAAATGGLPITAAALRRLARAPSGDLERAAARLASARPTDIETLAAQFARLFGHTARGLVCACETEYGPDNAFHQPQQLADLAGYYLAFGLQPAPASESRVDHIACELEFMDFLNRKHAWLLGGDPASAERVETLDATERAARTFLRDHLGRFGRAFATRVIAEDPDGYFGVLAHTLFAFLGADCARVGVEAGPVDLAVRPDVRDEAPMACGPADELIQIQRKP